MTRHEAVQRGAVCVVLGALATVAVAWGFAVKGPSSLASTAYILYGPLWHPSGGEQWIHTYQRHWTGGKSRYVPEVQPMYSSRLSNLYPSAQTRSVHSIGRGWGRSDYALEGYVGRSRGRTTFEHAFGWPRPALWFDGESGAIISSQSPGIGLPAAWGGPSTTGNPLLAKSLPLGPLWGGLMINTAVYAVLFAVPVFGWPFLRTRRRIKRGLCPRCGYDLAGAADCSECGWGK